MILGIIILKKKYVLREYLSIVMISVGICMCTLASAQDVKKPVVSNSNLTAEDEFLEFFWWVIGKRLATVYHCPREL